MNANVAVASDYFPAYARLPRNIQRKAVDFIRKFEADPTQSSINYEHIKKAIDPQLRSVRVGDNYRAIVRAPATGSLYVLLYIDKHDDAYRWAESKRMQVHPRTGTLQFFDVDEASAAVTSAEFDEAPESTAREHAEVFAEARHLFSDFTDEQLYVGGIPKILLPAVRAVHTDTDLDRLVEHIPQEAGDLLTGLAAGIAYDAVIEQLLSEPGPAADAPVAPGAPGAPVAAGVRGAPETEIDTTDIDASILRESSQSKFRLLDENFDLDKALAYPLDVWRIYLHPSQRKLVDARTKGPMRVTGGAGTGKTVVAMHRAAFLSQNVFTAPDDRILVTTFTRNLAHDIRNNLAKLLEPEELTRIEVTNIDAWAAEYLKSQGQPIRLATRKVQDDAWRSAFDLFGVPGFDLDFCRAEWDGVIQAQDIQDERAYVRAVRHHRGTRLARSDRRKLWELFSEYRSGLSESGVAESIDIIRKASELLDERGGSPRYRSVIVDETQDLSSAALRLVRQLAGPEGPDDLFLVGDAHQRIYGRPAPLSHAGINIRGRRSKELRLNYRTTAAICRWSLRVLGSTDYDDLDDGKASTRGYVSLRDGEAPRVRHFDHAAAERDFVVAEVRASIERGVLPEEICIVARTSRQLTAGYGVALESAGIEYEVLEKSEPRRANVRLGTMHRVKGLEFPVVFVVGVNAGFVPYESPDLTSSDRLVAARAEAQERCLLYVATSRARDALYVSSYGERSPFLEALDEPAKAAREPAVRQPERPARTAPVQADRHVVSPEKTGDEAGAEPASARVESAPPVASSDGEPLSTPLASLHLPTRLRNWALENGATTLRDIAMQHPLELLAERNLGRGTVGETRKVLERLLERRWEEVHRELVGADLAAAPRSAWEALADELPEELREHALSEVPLPTRMRNFVREKGIDTIGELIRMELVPLLREKNLGRSSIRDTREALIGYSGGIQERREVWESGFWESVRARFQELDSIPRMVITRRAGFGCAAETLEEIGITLGVTRERIRQIEKKAWTDICRAEAWSNDVLRRCDEVAPDGAVSLDVLEDHDWWKRLAAEPEALDYICDRLLRGKWRVIAFHDQQFLSTAEQAALDERAKTARDLAKTLPYPMPVEQVERRVTEVSAGVGESLRQEIWKDVQERLQLEGEGQGRRALAYGVSKAAQVIAFLEQQSAPVPVGRVVEELGRFLLPDEVFLLARGVVGLEKHFPEFREWQQRLAPLAIQLIEGNGPERQWSCIELIDDLRESIDLPRWLEHWHLAAILKRSEGIEYLGRLRVALPGVADESGRIHVHVALEKILRATNEPLAFDEIRKRLRERMDSSDVTMTMRLNRAPFLRVSDTHWGLLERDLPGGEEAVAEALDQLETTLQRRQRGLSSHLLLAEVHGLSKACSAWSREMCLSVVRNDPRFRLTMTGNVGLSEWEDVRVPSRLAVIQSSLEKSDGRVSVEAVQARLAAIYGSPSDRNYIGMMANRFGGGIDGDWVYGDGNGQTVDC